jgi:hypothetical protein
MEGDAAAPKLADQPIKKGMAFQLGANVPRKWKKWPRPLPT